MRKPVIIKKELHRSVQVVSEGGNGVYGELIRAENCVSGLARAIRRAKTALRHTNLG